MLSISSILNTILRVGTLGLKFIFISLLPLFFSIEEVGTYSLIMSSVSLMVLVLGLEYHYFSNRELAKTNSDSYKNEVLSTQVFLYLACYVATFWPACLYFEKKFDLGVAGVAFLFFSHAVLEFSRYFNIRARQIVASLILFLSQGGWVLLPMTSIYLYGNTLSVKGLVLVNLLVMPVSCIFAVALIRRELKANLASVRFDLMWRGLRIGMPLLVASLSIKGSEFSGRFFLDNEGLADLVGIFSYYQNIGAILVTILYSGVIVYAIPKMISARGNKDEFLLVIKTTLVRHISWLIVCCAVLIVATIPFFALLQKDELIEHKASFYLVLASYFFLSINALFSIMLYSLEKDFVSVVVNLSSAVVGAALMYMFVSVLKWQLFGASIAVLCWSVTQAFGTFFVVKYSVGMLGTEKAV